MRGRFWHLYALCLWWAEDIHEGHYLWKNDAQVRSILSELAESRPDDDDWLFEIIGQGTNRPETTELSDSGLHELSEYLSNRGNDRALQWHVLFEMTQCRTSESIWPETIHYAFLDLQFGGQPYIFSAPKGKHGSPGALVSVKAGIIGRVYFYLGKGLTKTAAREKVGSEIGVSVAALKKWEGELTNNPYYETHLVAAGYAGYHDEDIRERLEDGETLQDIIDLLPADDMLLANDYGMTLIERVLWAHHTHHRTSIRSLRQRLREARLRR